MKKIIYSWGQVQSACLDISRQLYRDNWRADYIVGINRGGLVPAALLSNYLNVPMETLKVSLRDDNIDCESNGWMAEDALGYCGIESKKNILIVLDINNTGATFEWIKNDWPKSCLPDDPAWNDIWGDNVRFASLANNLASSQLVDYSVWEVNKAENDCWLVFPWEEFWK